MQTLPTSLGFRGATFEEVNRGFVLDGGERAGQSAGHEQQVQLLWAIGECELRLHAESALARAFAGNEIQRLGDEANRRAHHAREK